MGRYLTPESKRKRLQEWHARRDDPVPPDKVGGYGYPDPEIFPWCDRLNALDGICTLQSCAGHRQLEGCETDGGLWIACSEPVMQEFYRHAYELAQHDTISRLRIQFIKGEHEVVDVEFLGRNRSRLSESMDAICRFFEMLVGQCAEPEPGRCTLCGSDDPATSYTDDGITTTPDDISPGVCHGPFHRCKTCSGTDRRGTWIFDGTSSGPCHDPFHNPQPGAGVKK